jgi:hypothetical protein
MGQLFHFFCPVKAARLVSKGRDCRFLCPHATGWWPGIGQRERRYSFDTIRGRLYETCVRRIYHVGHRIIASRSVASRPGLEVSGGPDVPPDGPSSAAVGGLQSLFG